MKKRIAVIALVAAIAAILVVEVACSSSNAVALLKTANQLADIWVGTYCPTCNLTELNAAFVTAETAAGNTGASACAQTVADVNAVSALLATFPQVSPTARLALATIAASVDLVASQFAQCAPPTVTQKVRIAATTPELQAVFDNPAKTPKELKAKWNAVQGLPDSAKVKP